MNLIFVETKTFTRKLFKSWNEESYFELQNKLLEYPNLGDVMEGGGGLRKIRWRGDGGGKSGGVRVIYFWAVRRDMILMLDIFRKNEKADLSDRELKELAAIRREMLGE